MDRIDTIVIGAGVVGLAVAVELAGNGNEVFVVEQHDSFGQETSSRNSEVIHAGIYYPRDSLKSRTCIEGKNLIYEYCQRHSIAHNRIGKLIVAARKSELEGLHALYENALACGVSDLVLLDKAGVREMEPYILAEEAIFSPSTGILDTHAFMKSLCDTLQAKGGQVAYCTEVTGIDKCKDGFRVKVKGQDRQEFRFLARVVINCAGLHADKVAGLAGLSSQEYTIKYCKGDYFRVHGPKAHYLRHLVYPVPKSTAAGLGVHATLDLTGSLRLGPDDEYVDRIYYDVDPGKAAVFYESARIFMPFIELKDISADMAGMRPKLQGPGEPFRDFIIKEESSKGLPGLINLIGIESPGLTASLAIARRVRDVFGAAASGKGGPH